MGIPVPYFRSSSYNNWDFCQQQYFLNYVLGLPRGVGKKAHKGTITHKVLEVLAKLKQAFDLTSDDVINIEDDEIGPVNAHRASFLSPYFLTELEIDSINRTRINSSTYKHDCKLPYGSRRYGVDLVKNLIKRVYDKYESQASDWQPVDFKDITNWVWMALEYKNGMLDPRRQKIVAPERNFDLPILLNGKEYLRIKGTIDLIVDIGNDTYEIVDYKGLPINTPIPTPKGWTTMGELKIGDIVFDKDGQQTKVLVKSDQLFKPCYEIEFDDTSKVTCDNEHYWTLSDNSVRQVTDLKINDKISVSKPLNLDKIDLPIDPYVLGIWLGDGRNRNGEIANSDEFIFNEIESRGYTLGNNLEKREGFCPVKTVLGLRTQLRKLGLLNNKHIPDIYLRSSYDQRLELLRGLMDSDGSVNIIRKQAVFTNCNKKLSDNVKELLLTLGQRPLQSNTIANGFNLKVQVFPISFRPININPFLLPRKANKIDVEWGSGKSDIRTIKQIKLIENKLTQCIMVDSPSRTYLCTENMIPTHNTGQRLDWATDEKKDYKKLCQDFQLMLYYYALIKLYPHVKNVIVTIFFIRDGGPFSICFENSNLDTVEGLLYDRWMEISTCTLPEMVDPTQRDFRCAKICDYFKTPSPDGKTNMCKFLHEKIKLVGIDKVISEHTHIGHNVSNYSAPGELKD